MKTFCRLLLLIESAAAFAADLAAPVGAVQILALTRIP